MKQSLKFSFLFIILCSFNSLFSQQKIKGKVIDGKTKEPLAFVNIIFNNDLHLGTTTDIDGIFYFSHAQNITSITCNYLGYKKLSLNIDSLKKENKELIIRLTASEFNLQEVKIIAGENPANRIIRKVIENKEINNPENISSFKYTSYNKSIYDLVPNDTLGKSDLKKRMDNLFRGGHLLIMESVTERKFMTPDINEEVITGVKVSGFKHPTFAPLATDLQPFSFYKDIIKIFDINYLNPISNGTLHKYNFTLIDTLYQNSDTVFIISFKPKPSKNFDGLKGTLYINTNKFAIQNVIAEPFEKGFINIKIQQQYTFIDNKLWFPKQLNFEISASKYPSKDLGASANGKSYIDEVELFPALKKKDFSMESIKMQELASDRDSIFWNKYRRDTLDIREKTTYQVIDSLGKENKFDAILTLMEKIAQSRIPIKFIDLDLNKTLVYNKFEGTRLGLGAFTNEKVLKFLSVGGYFGYGLKDKQWKYGAEAILTLSKKNEIEIDAKAQNTLIESGRTGLGYFRQNNYDYRNLITYQMDRVEQNSIAFSFRAIRYAKLNFGLKNSIVTPQYGYQYEPNSTESISHYINSEFTFNLKYAYKEKLIHSLNQRMSLGTKYPVLYVSYARGLKDFYNGAFDYNKIEARIEKAIYRKRLGETRFRLEGGYIDNPLPYGLLFTGEGSYDKDVTIIIKNSFQTVRPYEFLSDQYVNLHFTQNFGGLLFQTKTFKPHITFCQSAGWGTLSNPNYHKTIEFKTKEKGFYESGIVIDNIVRFNYLNIAYMGFGAGFYYRYGPYAYVHEKDNFAVKFSMTFSTK